MGNKSRRGLQATESLYNMHKYYESNREIKRQEIAEKSLPPSFKNENSE